MSIEQDDQEGVRTMDDDNFIDDSGVDPAYHFGSDNEAGSPGNAPQVGSFFSFLKLQFKCYCWLRYVAAIMIFRWYHDFI